MCRVQGFGVSGVVGGARGLPFFSGDGGCFPPVFSRFPFFRPAFVIIFSLSLVLGFVWGVVGCAWDASVWEGLGAPLGSVVLPFFPFL